MFLQLVSILLLDVPGCDDPLQTFDLAVLECFYVVLLP
uniref:Uncharacterized protein n=1 Tax=Arundo donax TaxID=35708 RepID=A0A0A9A3I1_ARUDO